MTLNQKWTRRQFTEALALSAAGSTLVRRGMAQTSIAPAGFAFAGSVFPNGSAGALHVFRISDSGWRPVQVVAAAAPRHLLLHPVLPVLYVLHDVAAWDHLPRGAVSTYAFDRHTGHLTLQRTQPLSLAATNPRHAAITAGASHLLVAAEGGGIYNLLPIADDGSLLPVAGLRKEFGMEDGKAAKVAAPRTLALHPDGSILAIDAGQASLTRFQLTGNSLAVAHRVRIHAEGEPAQLALAPSGSHAYTLQASTGSIAVHALHAAHSPAALQTFQAEADLSSIAIAPGGGFLLAAGSRAASVLRIDAANGSLSPQGRVRALGQQATFSPDGTQMFGFDCAARSIRQAAFDPATGVAGPVESVAQIEHCASLAVRMDTFA